MKTTSTRLRKVREAPHPTLPTEFPHRVARPLVEEMTTVIADMPRCISCGAELEDDDIKGLCLMCRET